VLSSLLLLASPAFAAAPTAAAASAGPLGRLETARTVGSAKGRTRLAERLTAPVGTERRAPQRARLLLDRACQAGFAKACHNLAVLLERGGGGPKGDARARELYLKACQAESQELEACGNLAVMLTQERGGPPDQKLAREVFDKLCDHGSAHACFNLGAMLWNGQGGPEGLKRAAALFSEACKEGVKQPYEVEHGQQ